MEIGDCRHFNGVQNNTCKAGINYQKLVHRGVEQIGILPCFASSREPKEGRLPAAPCDHYEPCTQDDVDARRAQIDAAMERHRKVGEVLGPTISAQRKLAKTTRTTQRAVYDCPVCGKPQSLGVSTSGYNGHAHGRCATPGCISWME